jgi:natural product biosynthesis luciferase-like monooxygenase protein/amino acid adenylation domain-containing protein
MKSQSNNQIADSGVHTTIVDLLRYRARQHGERIAYTFLADGEQEQESLTFSELDLRARRIAARLRQSTGTGERALLLYPAGVEYVAAFFGCLYAGVIAVPAYPPRENGGVDRIVSIGHDCQPAVILTASSSDQVMSRIGEALSERNLECVDTTRLGEDPGSNLAEWQDAPSDSSAIAFLQYTSGSTASPKGVMVTHANIMHNEEALKNGFRFSEKTIIVSWLPIYHDMGLIGGILATVYAGARCMLFSPAAFIQRPVRWLAAVSNYRATFSVAPNFAFDHCVRRVTEEQKAGLDLRSWTAVCNGAEPVRASTLVQFAESFASCGFRKTALQPGYGLAEATLMASCAPYGSGPVMENFDAAALAQHRVQPIKNEHIHSSKLVSSGYGIAGQEILIVDPETRRRCPPNRIGEIWLSSPSVAQGYWNKPAETKATFGARLANSKGRHFLRTEDLGILRRGQLYVTGRLKDLIIVNGRNHYPQDIELTVEQGHPALRSGFGAAFSIEADGEERLVVAYEVERSRIRGLNHQEVVDGICQVVAEQHEVAVHAVALVMPGGIAKTSSGKIQRRLCRQKFLAGELRLIQEKAQAAGPAVVTAPESAGVTVIETLDKSTVAPSSPALKFSLFYFSSNEAEFEKDKYRLFMEGTKFADDNGFEAVWIPERHFHAFGGIYPNPSVLAAAVAMITKQIRIRAGSVVLPLHNPIRVAEEWSVVDNLSGGRIDLAFARGWNPNDFALWPAHYADSLKALYEGMKKVLTLWRGEAVSVPNGKGENTEIHIYPLPKQKDLQVWITCTGAIERFIEAGEGGWNVLTALLFQSVEELEVKIKAYREARARSGFDPNSGRVTLMLHTFLGSDDELVKETVRAPFTEYLRTSVDLWRQLSTNLNELDAQERTKVLNYAFERYYRTAGLFGTPDGAFEFVSRLARAGVQEIASLIDFGIETDAVLRGLHSLNALHERVNPRKRPQDAEPLSLPPINSGAESEVRANAFGGAAVAERIKAPVPGAESAAREHDTEWNAQRSNDRVLLGWVKHSVESAICRVMRLQTGVLSSSKNFFRLGIDSIKAIEILDALQMDLDVKISPAAMFDLSTIDDLSGAIAKEHYVQLRARMDAARPAGNVQPDHTTVATSGSLAKRAIAPAIGLEETDGIAIIGLACKFPGAPSLSSFWELLREGRDATSEVPPDHWDWRPYFDSDPSAEKKTYSRWGGFVDDIDMFDASFFDISGEEARAMDPQQRIFIETAWQALEHAGYSPESLTGKPVGVFVGASYNGYYQRVINSPSPSASSAGIGNQNAIIANRLSFLLNLSGPSILIDTLCSSSLIAIHLACQSVKQGECEMAIVGGVNSLLSPQNYVAMSRMKLHSPDGCCRAFDHKANGIVYGEGAGAILLKPLTRALADGDHVYAVVKGSAVNHGGRSSALGAPHPQMQAQVIRQALDVAQISAETISYVEAHGTGTALGDALEIHSLSRAFEQDSSRLQYCRIGSVKTNIGHLEAAGGIAGIIKVVLAMQHRELPPSLHFENANPLLSIENSQFAMQISLSAWNSDGPRRAGINAFGIGGANAHVILEESPAREIAESVADLSRPVHLLTLSAKTASALRSRARDLASLLTANPSIPLADLCFTANAGRAHFAHRLAVVVRDGDSLLAELRSFAETGAAEGAQLGHADEEKRPTIAFLFSGESGDSPEMLELLKCEPEFHQAVERFEAVLHGYKKEPEVFASGAADSGFARRSKSIVLQYALSDLLKSWGIIPEMVAGCGVGEFVAAHVAGALSLEDAIMLAGEETSEGAQFEKSVSRTSSLQLRIPLVSVRDGRLLQPGELLNGASWRRPVSMASQLNSALAAFTKESCDAILSVGTHDSEAEAKLYCAKTNIALLPSLHGGPDSREVLLRSLGRLYTLGCRVDWMAFHQHSRRHRVALPTYPFERERFWIDAPAPEMERQVSAKSAAVIASDSKPAALAPPGRKKEEILQWLRVVLAGFLKRQPEEIQNYRPLLEMGADSMVLTGLMHRVQSELGAKLEVWQLFVDLTTLDKLAQHISEKRPAEGSIKEGHGPFSGFRLPGPDPSVETIHPLSSLTESAVLDRKVFHDLPLSIGQTGLWFLQRMAPECSAYNMVAASEVEGPLDVPALHRAFQALVDRHGALRTTFHSQPGSEPIQRIHELMDLEFKLLEAEVGEDAVANQVNDCARRPFDLEKQSAFRVMIVRRGSKEHNLVLVMHHLLGDFWSFAVIFDELRRLYLQETANTPANLAPLTASFHDWVNLQNRVLNGPRGRQLWEYWQETLKPPLAKLEMPTDHMRPPVQTYRGASQTLTLDPELTQRLQDFSTSRHATLFMTLLASFQLLLNRYTGQEDIVVGAPAAGRNSHEAANTVGYFVNPLLLRAKVLPSSSFAQMLGETVRSVSGALQHQDYPFPLLIERLRPERDPSTSPLFQVMFILEQTQYPELEALSSYAMGVAGSEIKFGPLTFRSMALPERQVPFDLVLMVSEQASGLVASLQYNRDLFEEDTIRRMLARYRLLIESIVVTPDKPIQDLPFLVGEEQKELREWNATESVYSSCLIHDLFRQQAARTPENMAVEDAHEKLIYRELDVRSDRVAERLIKLGVGLETVVGVCLGRSVQCAVILLGVLKAGAVYLPLDPALPDTRLQFMIEDASVKKVITEARFATLLPSECVILADDLENSSHCKNTFVDAASFAHRASPVPENLAYIVYTSGSTGKPKGVQVSHKSVVNFLASMARNPGLTERDVLVSVTTISFDIFGLELYLPLITGAKVVFASREVSGDGEALLELIRRCGATVMQATPATWQLLLATTNGKIPVLRALIGGDVLPCEVAVDLLAVGCQIWNLYGPSETTIWSACHRVTGCDTTSISVPIGRAIANTQIYVMDPNLQPVPPGVPGELLIGGDGIARGYFDRQDLTAEKFIPDAMSQSPGARLYRTGDLGRYRADGVLEFLGRLDNQVKVRGYRIELGEIESALANIPGIDQAVVISRKQSHSDHRLIAYMIRDPGKNPHTVDNSPTLRQLLLERLPEAFVPADFVFLETLPLTPNGKVDRKALAQYEYRPTSSAAHLLPRSRAEREVAQAWLEVLKLERVSVHDNFFDLGGHSLLLAEVHGRLTSLGYALSIVDLLRYPTVASLVTYIGSDAIPPKNLDRGSETKSARRLLRQSEVEAAEIAIIGMAGRFPKAANVEEFWKNVLDGDECVSFFSPEELAEAGVDRELLANPRFVPACGTLEGSDLFDAEFFGFNPRQAALMDPQQRLFLECAWHALENAGYDSSRFPGRTGVFAGAGMNTYILRASHLLNTSQSLRYQAFIGNDKDFLSTLVSYKLNLRGPSISVQTACSTSLVAIHLACQSLLRGECDMALAGAVSVRLPQEKGYIYEEDGILSADGHCRAFDANAGGTVFGSGMGIVVLKPLQNAIDNGDHIRAIIKGSAINNDGNRKVGYSAPSVEGQAEVISEALAVAGVEPETITYIEAHGTGTALGDPVEIAALTTVFHNHAQKKHTCAIGSVKTNVGHLDTAAGVTGLIKTVCAMEHNLLPRSLHFTAPNPEIDFDSGPFYVNTATREWNRNGGPRRAGISSFGIGGTNAHVVLEEAPSQEATLSSEPWQLLLLSARTLSALETSTENLLEALKTESAIHLADAAYTTQTGRHAFAHRRSVLCRDRGHAIQVMEQMSPTYVCTAETRASKREVVFLFPGQGSQAVNMGRGLYESEPAFRREVDNCAESLKPHLGLDLRHILFPSSDSKAQASLQLGTTEYAQPALFVIEYALSCLWMEFGVTPAAMLGHSLGEYVAACLAGVFSLTDALALVAARGRLMQSSSPGAMLSVRMAELELIPFLSADLAIAAVNAPSACVVSGTEESIRAFEQTLARKDVVCKRLPTDRAYHSELMESILDGFLEQVSKMSLHAPAIPYISNVSGTWITEEQATNPSYWTEHLRQAVRFADGLESVIVDPGRILLEVGHGQTLTSFARQQRSQALAVTSLPLSQERNPDRPSFLKALGQLWSEGVEINWGKLHGQEKRKRVPLPGYPFQRQRYWIDIEKPIAHQDAVVELPRKTAAIAAHSSHELVADSAKPVATDQLPKGANRKTSILAVLVRSMTHSVGMDGSEIDSGRSFLEMGYDSLVLMGALQDIRRTFNLKLSIRQLFEDLNTLDALADYIDRGLPESARFKGWPAVQETPDSRVEQEQAVGREQDPSVVLHSTKIELSRGHSSSVAEREQGAHSELERIMARQTAAMNQLFQQQLEVLRLRQPESSLNTKALPNEESDHRLSKTSADSRVDETLAQAQPWVPYQPFNPGSLENLTPQQRIYLSEFVGDYARRTKRSKESTQTHRFAHADLRASMSFRLSTKEIRYPIVGTRSKGAHLWDLDDNRYIDFTMGFGVNLFGHSPRFVTEAIEAQLEKGIQVGPQTELVGEVAALICELTGMDRATFCNSGTEAVMAALRMARVSTGKRKVAVFAGSYHGTADGVLVGAKMQNGKLSAIPLVPGVCPGMVEDMIVLNYGSARSLQMIRACADQLAAVLVEPVQSRKPELQPAAFLKELRSITEEAGIALIFDEMITGFRVHQRGAQGWFGVKADLATYGKVIGGGMPIGVVAGNASFMNCIDGGMWKFGDMSVPSARTTLHTGTFYKHPLSMAAARAIMLEIKSRGPALFTNLNEATEAFAERLNHCFREMEVPIEVVRFGSLFRLGGPLQLMSSDALDLLFYHLIHNGVYVWEGRNWFLSTAHQQEELDSVVAVLRESITRMRDAGFTPRVSKKEGGGEGTAPGRLLVQSPTDSSAGSGSAAPPPTEITLQTPRVQKELWLMSRTGQEVSLSYNQTIALRLRGVFDSLAFSNALETVSARHEALRTVFDSTGEKQRVLPSVQVEVGHIDLASLSAEAQDKEISDWLNQEALRPFNLLDNLLWRVAVLKRTDIDNLVVLTIHHVIADGWSTGILLQEIGEAYSAQVDGNEPEYSEALQLRDYVRFLDGHLDELAKSGAANYWLRELNDSPKVRYPIRSTESATRAAARLTRTFDPALNVELTALSSQLGATVLVTLMAAYHFFLSRITGHQDFVVVTPVAGQLHMESPSLVGDCSNLVALRAKLSSDLSFADWVNTVKKQMLDCADYMLYPFAEVVRQLSPRRDPSRWALFNVDRPSSPVRFGGIRLDYVPTPIAYSNFDFGLNLTIFSGGVQAAFDYRTKLFSRETLAKLSNDFESLLRHVIANPLLRLSDWVGKEQPTGLLLPENEPEAAYIAPRTEVEKMVAALWQDVLGRERLSVFSDFFELGGHSLLATQIVSRVRDTFGVDLSLEDLFQQPSIVGIAAIVETLLRRRDQRVPELIPRVSHDHPLPVSFAQRRLWLIHQLEPDSAAYNITGAIRLSGALDLSAIENALDHLIKRHESLRTVFLKADAEPVQQVRSHTHLALETINLEGQVPLEGRNSVLVERGQQEAQRPFQLAQGPLFRACLLKFAADDNALIVAVHHIVCDGWSAGILLREIGLLYDAFASNRNVDLPELRIQFGDYAVWQRKWLQGETLRRQIDFWVQQLAGAPHFLNLATDRPRTAAPSFKGAHEPFQLSEAISSALRQFCREQGVTPHMVLLAVFSLLLSRRSGQDDLIVGTDVANRNRREVEGVVGFFVNLLPLRLKPSAKLTFREYVRQVRKMTLDAYGHQDVPFDHLVRALRPDRKLTSTPLVQVLFVFQNIPVGGVVSESIRMEPIPIPMKTSEFELILSMQEEPNLFSGSLGYSIDLYERSTISSLITELVELLRLAMRGTDTPLSSLESERLMTETSSEIASNVELTSEEFAVLDEQIKGSS